MSFFVRWSVSWTKFSKVNHLFGLLRNGIHSGKDGKRGDKRDVFHLGVQNSVSQMELKMVGAKGFDEFLSNTSSFSYLANTQTGFNGSQAIPLVGYMEIQALQRCLASRYQPV